MAARPSMRLAALAAALTLGLDQATKLAVIHIAQVRERGDVNFIDPLLNFRWAENRGINFGLLAGHADITRWLLIALALAISVWVWLWVRRDGASRPAQIGAGLLVGGALGNVIDRIAYGYVADFLNMSCCGIENPYSFNVADIAIFAGAAVLVVFSGKAPPGGPARRGKPDRKTP